ncbi:sodium-dependent transporter [Rickettsiales bacterium LUAb2]
MSNKGFVSSMGALIVAIGSAVGLGNIWKFPYEMGKNGGALFLIGYIIVTLIICIPLMIAEFTLGRAGKSGAIKAIKSLAPSSSWWFLGVLTVITISLISFYYTVVGGWIMYYLYATIFMNINSQTDTALYFNNFIHNKYGPSLGVLVFLLLNFFISARGVQKGLEKCSLWMIPLLGVFLVGLVIYSFTLPNVGDAMTYVFKPDFTKFTSSTMVEILAQAFFSLSLGMGIMIVYGSYMLKSDNLIKTAINTSIISAVVVSLLSSILVFNISFAYNIPAMAGPGLIFMAFPKVFAGMHGGYIIGIAFYILVLLAAITSMISILEVPISFVEESTKYSRKRTTTLVSSIVFVMGILVALSMADIIPIYKITSTSVIVAAIIGVIISSLLYFAFKKHISLTYNKNKEATKFYAIVSSVVLFIIIMLLFYYNREKNLFDILDSTTSNFFIPIGGVLTAVFMGWIVDKQLIKQELNVKKNRSIWFNFLIFANRYIVPIVIIVMIIYPFI